MYDTSYSDYSYSNSNPGTAFLDSHMQSTYASAGTQSSFGAVMSSMAGGVTQNAAMGIMPGSKPSNISPEQLAAQMNLGGPMSVLPYLGGETMQKLVFPIAGLWSMVDGVKAVSELRRDAAQESKSYKRFDPSQLSYNKASQRLDSVESDLNYY